MRYKVQYIRLVDAGAPKWLFAWSLNSPLKDIIESKPIFAEIVFYLCCHCHKSKQKNITHYVIQVNIPGRLNEGFKDSKIFMGLINYRPVLSAIRR